MKRYGIGLFAAVCMACGDDTEGTSVVRCELATAFQDYAGLDASIRSCGRMRADASAAQYASARGCILGSLDAGVPFSWTLELQGIDSLPARAYAWSGSGPVHAFSYDSDPTGGSGGPGAISEATCDNFELQSCGQSPLSFCIGCTAASGTLSYEPICPAPR